MDHPTLPAAQDPSGYGNPTKKPKTARRHGACNPCKASKTRCDGEMPCGACRSEKRKSRTCEYSEKAKSIQAAREEGESRKGSRRCSSSTTSGDSEPQEQWPPLHSTPVSRHRRRNNQSWHVTTPMYRRLSLYGVVDEFIQAKPSKGQAAQHVKRVQDQWHDLQALLEANSPATAYPIPLPKHESHQSDAESPIDGSQATENSWQSRIYSTLRLLNHGEFTRAWREVPSLMRDIEALDFDLGSGTSTSPWTYVPLEQSCLQILEIDCMLSFLLGGQSMLPTWQRSKLLAPMLEQWKGDTHLAAKVDVYNTIQKLLDIDTSHEAGMWQLLHFAKGIKHAQPARLIEQKATCTTKTEPGPAQELKLVSNLVFMVMYCRTASACGHYSQDECVLPPMNGGPSDIIHDLKLSLPKQKGDNCGQVKKHAGLVLEAFEILCEIEPEATARCWFRLFGALIAAVVLGVHGLRERTSDWESIKATLNNVERCFTQLRHHNPNSPIFDHACSVLRKCDQKKSQASITSKTQPARVVEHEESDSTSSSDTSGPRSRPGIIRIGPTARPSLGKRKRSDPVDTEKPTSKVRVRKQFVARRQSVQATTAKHEHQPNSISKYSYGASAGLTYERSNFYGHTENHEIEAQSSFPSNLNAPFADEMPPAAVPVAMNTRPYMGMPHMSSLNWDIHPPMVIDDFEFIHPPLAYREGPCLPVKYQDLPSWQVPHQPGFGTTEVGSLQTGGHALVSQSPIHSQLASPSRQHGHEAPVSTNDASVSSNADTARFFNVTRTQFENQSLVAPGIERSMTGSASKPTSEFQAAQTSLASPSEWRNNTTPKMFSSANAVYYQPTTPSHQSLHGARTDWLQYQQDSQTLPMQSPYNIHHNDYQFQHNHGYPFKPMEHRIVEPEEVCSMAHHQRQHHFGSVTTSS